jgi:hypothetical protein
MAIPPEIWVLDSLCRSGAGGASIARRGEWGIVRIYKIIAQILICVE